jgi:hypothetical protein
VRCAHGRPYFYTAGTLVKEGIIQLSERWGDLMGVKIELDRRMLDFIVGLDTEFSELVEGSHRYLPLFVLFIIFTLFIIDLLLFDFSFVVACSYYPKVKMEQVVLPDDSKKLILETVEGTAAWRAWRAWRVRKLSFTHTYENSTTTIARAGFECYKKFRKDLGFEETITYGNGILLLFYGTPPGSLDFILNSFFNSFTNCFCLLFISK